jgi:hypothetical protein
MKVNVNRSFGCKNEELPVVCGFGATSLARDLGDFTAYSSLFDAAYLAAFKTKIDVVSELVKPKSETVELKVLTDRIYQTLDGLIPPVNHLEGYLKMAGREVPLSTNDFGLVQLRKAIRSRDVESVLAQLHTVGENIGKYKSALMARGLTEELITRFAVAARQLAEDKNRKYSLVSNRAAMVQKNLGLLNDLNDQLTEICRIGKILYKQTDPAKVRDYTFTKMMNQVRASTKPAAAKKEVAVTA